jgi:hypothetical protein
MAVWKTSWTPIYIQNHEIHKNICIYEPETGQSVEKDRSEFPEIKETWRGFYKSLDSGVMGIFATDKGPVFFVNDRRYLLTEKEWDFEVESIGNNNIFSFWFDKKEQLKIDYKKTDDLGIHTYVEEDVIDFFVWMTKKKKSKTFIEFYTLEV